MGNKICNGNKRGTSNKFGKHLSKVVKNVCDFCLQSIHLENSFNIKGCTHSYCQQCIVKFIVSNLQLNVTSITCPVPGCAGVLDPEHCRQILPSDVFVSWSNALSESVLSPESDIDSTFICDFCVEPVNLKDSFNIRGCTHFYCQGCIVKFIASKRQDNVTRIMCPVPGCTGTLDLEYCRAILPKDVCDRWGKALCESVVMALMGTGKKYLYCPFNACSALLIHEDPEGTTQSVCPHCKREFCAKCKVPWHTEFDCANFQKLEKGGEDKMLEELAKKKRWRRCPNCKYYVERKSGCSYMKCRCQYIFCYKCGAKRSDAFHHCSKNLRLAPPRPPLAPPRPRLAQPRPRLAPPRR
ncbi:hypothetical protein TB2_026259 [Malus domestica]